MARETLILDAPESYRGPDADASCGPSRASVDVVPDQWLGLDVFEACAVHDHEYGKGGTEATRKIADVRFRKNLVALVVNRGGLFVAPRFVLAWVYFAGVRLFGRRSFG